MTPDRDEVPTQADREAAAAIADGWWRNMKPVEVASIVREGLVDDSRLVQSFQRHRLAAEQASAARIAELEQRCAELEDGLRPFGAVADEWDRWQKKGSTSTPGMVGLSYGRCRFGLVEYQAARALLTNGSRNG